MSPRIIDRHNQISCEDGLIYLADCTLATVETLAIKRKPPAGELRRQIDMAQSAVDCLVRNSSPLIGTRTDDVVRNFNKSVQAWANHVHEGAQE
jgi:hypothetical protein